MLARLSGTILAAATAVATLAAAALFAYSSYAIHPLALPAVALASGYVVLAIARPAYGVAGALVATALGTTNLTLPIGAISPAEAGFATVAVAFVVRSVLRPETVATPTLHDVPVAFLLLAVAVGIVAAEDPAPVLRVTCLWSLFYLVYLQAQSFTEAEMRLVVFACAIGAGVLGAVGFVTFLQAGSHELLAGGAITSERAQASFEDPNYYASLLTLALLPSVALMLHDLRRNAWLLLPAGAAFLGLAFSLSRGAMLGAAVGLLLLLAWRRARRVALLGAAVLTVVTLAGANPLVSSEYFSTVQERLSTISDPTRESRRPQIWAAAIDMASEHPFFGVGMNQFEFEAAERTLYERGDPVENAHNIYLSLAAETGLIGLGAFLAFALVVAMQAAVASGRGRQTGALSLGLSAAMLAFLVQGLTVAQIRVSVLVAILFLYAGMVTGLARRAREPST